MNVSFWALLKIRVEFLLQRTGLVEELSLALIQQSGHLMEYRAGIFCGEVEVVLSNSNYGIEFLKLFEHDGIHENPISHFPIL